MYCEKSGEKSCLQFSIPTGSGAGGEGGVSHSLKDVVSCSGFKKSIFSTYFESIIYSEYTVKI